MLERYGATVEDWTVFDVVFGLTEDLLPVVSNPHAAIAPNSSLKTKGKVPSKYNGHGQVVGIPQWTSHRSKPEEINQWTREKDYGLCLQTRHVRAIDIDVARSEAITLFIRQMGFSLPLRKRSNSGKCLLAFRLAGVVAKKVIKVDGGIIEFLANGQQFVAAGTHPSGARYEWEPFSDIPELSLGEFEYLWGCLDICFGVGVPSTGSVRRHGEDLELEDETIAKLAVLGWGPEGQAHIACPFSSEHTADSGISATSYFPAGTRGYKQGHFVCLHAHCAGRGDEEFLDALGLRAAEFEPVLEEKKEDAKLPAAWPAFKRTEAGEIYPTVDNLYQALKRDDVVSVKIAYDGFRDEVVLTSPKSHALAWRALADNDYTVMQRHLERAIGFKPIAVDLLRRTVEMVAYENNFDSAQLWLGGLEWDGVPRVGNFLAGYMKAEDSAYNRAVSGYIWTALAGRVLVPGIKADMVPIFESPEQGKNKSSTVEALAPDPEYFIEVDLNEKETDIIRKMRGKLVAEINELRGLQTRDAQTINAFITRRHEEWIPKYREKSKRFARRLVFFGTTNLKEILGDDTGHRRWLPTQVGRADLEAIKRDRDQLWAEGSELFRKSGILWQDAERLAPVAHKDYTSTDPWAGPLCDWLEMADMEGNKPASKGYVTIAEIMRDALHIETRNMKGADAKRIARVMKENGYERAQKRLRGRMERVWVKTLAE